MIIFVDENPYIKIEYILLFFQYIMSESELLNTLKEANRKKLNDDINNFEEKVKTKLEFVECEASYGKTQIDIKRYNTQYPDDSHNCYIMHKFARRLNENDEFPLKIRYKDDNMILPAGISNPKSCRFYFDWKPTMIDSLRYKCDDLIGWFGF